MAQEKGLFKETIIYSIGSFGSKILAFLLVPLYSFFLSKKDLGEYDLFLTTITLLVPLVSLQISDASYRWLIEKKDIKDSIYKTKIFTNSIFIFLLAFFIFTILFYIYIAFFDQFVYSHFFVPTLFFSCLLPFLQSFLRGVGKTKEFAVNGVLTSFLMVVFNVLFIFILHLKVEGILIANIIANGIACVLIIIKLNFFKSFNVSYLDKSLIKRLLAYSLPLIPNLMSWWLISSASKFIILKYMGVDANGLYAISSRFPSILILINSVLMLPIQDAFLKSESNDYSNFNTLVIKFIKLELILVLLLSIGAPIYSKFIISNEFYSSWKFMPLLFLGVGFNTIGALITLIFQKEKKTLRITITTLLGGAFSVGSCFLLINEFGLQGVSLSFLLGYFVMTFLRYHDVKRNSSFQLFIPNELFFYLILVILINIIIIYFEIPFYIFALLFISSIFVFLVVNKKFITNFIISKKQSLLKK